MKLFDQYIRNLRGKDHCSSDIQVHKSMSSGAATRLSTLDVPSNKSMALPRIILQRQQTVDAAISGHWTSPPAFNSPQEGSSHPKFIWASSPLTKPQQVHQFNGLLVEAPQAASSLPVAIEEEDTEVGTQEPQNSPVKTRKHEVEWKCYKGPDGYCEAEVWTSTNFVLVLVCVTYQSTA